MRKLFTLVVTAVALTGCSHYVEMKDVYIDNRATNNLYGNPCGFYVGDHCVYMKKYVRDPNNPYTK